MKKRRWMMLTALILGSALAFMQEGSGGNLLLALLKPFSALGSALRGWSLSGAAGNAAAWCVMVLLSLLPVAYILIVRRKRKQAGDWMWLVTGAGIFGCLFLLINPTLAIHPMLAVGLLEGTPEAGCLAPVMTMFSLLLTSTVLRWSGGLNEGRLIFWTRALLTATMALVALSVGMALAESVLAVWPVQGAEMALSAVEEVGGSTGQTAAMGMAELQEYLGGTSEWAADSDAVIGLILSLISLIPDLYLLWLMDAAAELTAVVSGGWFSRDTEAQAEKLALRARYALISTVVCMAARNLLTTLLARWMSSAQVKLELPLTELLVSCGAMLLARLMGAACRVKRDNDLMI